jgi:hypothetical protein
MLVRVLVGLVVDWEGEQVVAEILPLPVPEILEQHVICLEQAKDGLVRRDAAVRRQAFELVVGPALERSERLAERLLSTKRPQSRNDSGVAEDRVKLRPRAADVGVDDAPGSVDREAGSQSLGPVQELDGRRGLLAGEDVADDRRSSRAC